MQVNDRGSKKWAALMLSEHAEALKKLFVEQDHKEKPILDNQQMKENEYKLQQAIEDNQEVEIHYYKDNNFHIERGFVLFIQPQKRYLQLDDVSIKLDDIIEVN